MSSISQSAPSNKRVASFWSLWIPPTHTGLAHQDEEAAELSLNRSWLWRHGHYSVHRIIKLLLALHDTVLDQLLYVRYLERLLKSITLEYILFMQFHRTVCKVPVSFSTRRANCHCIIGLRSLDSCLLYCYHHAYFPEAMRKSLLLTKSTWSQRCKQCMKE